MDGHEAAESEDGIAQTQQHPLPIHNPAGFQYHDARTARYSKLPLMRSGRLGLDGPGNNQSLLVMRRVDPDLPVTSVTPQKCAGQIPKALRLATRRFERMVYQHDMPTAVEPQKPSVETLALHLLANDRSNAGSKVSRSLDHDTLLSVMNVLKPITDQSATNKENVQPATRRPAGTTT
ncbi:hypothetical protein BAUCODRAFT_234272 [Baudoinia panamericana UAMH 10762]|uniref:Uncharacterized protein n=1 Tax=Baudoinia panamericana (strain UAMH 10762) TaxID=717646 RepID=M2N2P5_BAUPA|nr:uncharacterized protein BAUCODRAFT_234272 [Baudoinia panamericana UAMH 10762]EMC93249.1 hypothetical protein BAUCODRAFT_234272 [Baudoinia panamericana UAMH 10762]